MQFRPLDRRVLASAALLLTGAGCQSWWTPIEPVSDAIFQPRQIYTQEMSRKELADTVGKPSAVRFFGNQAVYLGDQDGYRYVHVREIFDFWDFLGECDYRVPASQWPMKNPMPLTTDSTKWRNVAWMNGDAPEGVAQNAFMKIEPVFPLGVSHPPATTHPTTTEPAATQPTTTQRSGSAP